MQIFLPLTVLALAVLIVAIAGLAMLRRGLRRKSAFRRREALYMPLPQARSIPERTASVLPHGLHTSMAGVGGIPGVAPARSPARHAATGSSAKTEV